VRELPSLPLYVPVYTYGINETVHGVQMPPLYDSSDRFLLISQWYLVTRRSLEKTVTPEP